MLKVEPETGLEVKLKSVEQLLFTVGGLKETAVLQDGGDAVATTFEGVDR
jgi:hypothetical protein